MEVECHCQEIFSVAIPEIYDLDNSSNLLQDIFEGSFWTIECPHCKNKLKIEESVIFQFKSRSMDIGFVPETQRGQFLIGKKQFKQNISRVVIGYKELTEKLKIFNENKNDKVIEILKFSFLMKTSNSEKIKIYYKGQVNDKLEFYIDGLKDDQISLTSIPFSAYTKIENTYEANWSSDWESFLTPPYIQANQISWEQ